MTGGLTLLIGRSVKSTPGKSPEGAAVTFVADVGGRRTILDVWVTWLSLLSITLPLPFFELAGRGADAGVGVEKPGLEDSESLSLMGGIRWVDSEVMMLRSIR